MQKVKINKTRLLEALRKNRTQHVQDHAEAKTAYDTELLIALRDATVKLENGRDTDLRKTLLDLEPPTSYEKEYDRAIAMLDFSSDDVIELTQQEFRSYVLDEWAWKEQFSASNSRYTGKFGA